MRSMTAAAPVALMLLLLAASASAFTCPKFAEPANPNCPGPDPCHWQHSCAAARTWCVERAAGMDRAASDPEGTQTFAFVCHAGSVVAEFACAIQSANCTGNVTLNACDQDPVELGNATDFVILAGASVSSLGGSNVTGTVGLYPAALMYVTGPITAHDDIHAGDDVSGAAQSSLTTAYNDAAGRVLCPSVFIGNLGGMTLYPGLYKSTSGFEITGSDLTLDAQHDTRAVFIFQMASTFLAGTGRRVILTNGAKASNIYYQVGSSATLSVGSVVMGNMMAYQSISTQTGVTVEGRILARVASVTIDSAKLSLPM